MQFISFFCIFSFSVIFTPKLVSSLKAFILKGEQDVIKGTVKRRKKKKGLFLVSSLLGFSILIMAPLDLDKYVEISRHCKYLPENDLKVSFLIKYSVVTFLMSVLGNGVTLTAKFVHKAWLSFIFPLS